MTIRTYVFALLTAIVALFASPIANAKVIRYIAAYKNGAPAAGVNYQAVGSNFLVKGKADSGGRFIVDTGATPTQFVSVTVTSTYKNARGYKRTSLRGKKNPKLQKIRLSKPLPKDKTGPVITGVSPAANAQVWTKEVTITVDAVDDKTGVASVAAFCGKDLGAPLQNGTQYSWKAALGSETLNTRYNLRITAINNRGIATTTTTPFEVMAPLIVRILNNPAGTNWPIDVRFFASSGYPITSVVAMYAGKEVGIWKPKPGTPLPTLIKDELIRITEPLEGNGPITLVARDTQRQGTSAAKLVNISNKMAFRFWKRIPFFTPGAVIQREGLIYVANEYSGEIVVMNPSNGFQVVNVFDAGINTPHMLALSGINNELMAANLFEGYRTTISGDPIGSAQPLGYRGLFSLPTLPILSMTPEGIGVMASGRRARLFPYAAAQQPFEMDADLSTRMTWITKPIAQKLRIGSLDNLSDGPATGKDVPLNYRPGDIAHVSGYDMVVVGNSIYLQGDAVVLHLHNTQGVEFGAIDLLAAIPDLAAVKDFVYEPRTKCLIVAFQSTIDANDKDNSGIAVFQLTNP